MKKAAIIIASGFEEGEALTIANIIKRAHLQCDQWRQLKKLCIL